MMGPIELLLVGLATIAAVVVVAVVRTHSKPPAIEAAPIPVVAVAIAAGTIVAGGLLAAASGGWFVERFVLPRVGDVSVILASTRDPWVSHIYGSMLLATWLGLPGVCAVAWLLLGKTRSVIGAVLFALGSWLGFAVGMAAGSTLVPPIVDAMTADLGDVSVGLVGLVRVAAGAMFALGATGASFAGVAIAAAADLRRTLWASAALPMGALLVAALVTPPDPLTQLLAAGVVGIGWLAGLGVGAVASTIRGGKSP